MQDLPAPDRVAGHPRNDRLRHPPDLDVQVACVEPTDPLPGDLVVAHVAVGAPDALIAAGAKGVLTGAREDHRGDVDVVPSAPKRVAKLREGLGAKRVADSGAVDRDPAMASPRS